MTDAIFERLPPNFKQGDLLGLGRAHNLYPAGANGSDGQFLYRSNGLWVPHSLVPADMGNPGGSEGDILYWHSGAWASLPVGPANTVLHGRTLVPTDPAYSAITAADLATAFPAWTAYTPTISSSAGTITSASGTGRAIQVGKLLIGQVSITITTVGTASGFLQYTLPNSLLSAAGQMGNAYNANAATVLLNQFIASSNLGFITLSGGGFPAGSGQTVVASFTIEVQ